MPPRIVKSPCQQPHLNQKQCTLVILDIYLKVKHYVFAKPMLCGVMLIPLAKVSFQSHSLFLSNINVISAAVDCEPLPDPSNGIVTTDRTTLGGTATYTCVLGYIISGTEQRTCTTSGRWSDSSPTCQSKKTQCLIDCLIVNCHYSLFVCDNVSCAVVRCTSEVLMNPVNGHVITTQGIIFESVAMYDCNEGFAVIGDQTRTCGADGEWTGSAPECQSMLLHTTLSYTS